MASPSFRLPNRRPPLSSLLGGAAVLALAAGGCSDEADSQPVDLQRAADRIRDLGVPAVLIEWVDGDRRNAVQSGVADLALGDPVPAQAHFRVASNTKALVATVALQLVGEGRLALDDTVERWLPGLITGNGNDGRQITIRDLLPAHQRSGGLRC